jgi:hypothetical protein
MGRAPLPAPAHAEVPTTPAASEGHG